MVRTRSLFVIFAVLASALAVTGCGHKKMNPEIRLDGASAFAPTAEELAQAGARSSEWNPVGAPSAANPNGVPDAQYDPFSFDADATGSIPNTADTDGVEDAVEIADLEMVHFDYDRSELKPEWQTILEHHAQWLVSHPRVSVQVEGHCDERGTEEYNLSLGQRRADSVRTYLVEKGVDPNRISTISYGKLRPLTFDENAEANALNRRAMFLVYQPGPDTMSASNY
ncbi:peptidoglycan-associated lipoprotein Pal [bacterium]|nr:peptidoglycan-associated lipoprotein Pal [bacterium]